MPVLVAVVLAAGVRATPGAPLVHDDPMRFVLVLTSVCVAGTVMFLVHRWRSRLSSDPGRGETAAAQLARVVINCWSTVLYATPASTLVADVGRSEARGVPGLVLGVVVVVTLAVWIRQSVWWRREIANRGTDR